MPKQPAGNGILIKKASGEQEHFDVSKLKRSLHNAGADNKIIREIAADIEKWLYEGATTKKIYARAFTQLRRKNNRSAIRYKLKQALLALGPTGYPFEHFIGEVFKKLGYQTEVGQILDGRCITHEMDVIATNDHKQLLMECKYSVDQGKSVSIQVPLYVRSRVNDIIERRKAMPEYKSFTFTGCIVTNMRFTPDSIEYGKCSGLQLLGWDYPKENNLKAIIERANIFPLTILHQLTKKEKQQLLDKGIVSCSQLLDNMAVLDTFHLSKRKHNNVRKELQDICGDL